MTNDDTNIDNVRSPDHREDREAQNSASDWEDVPTDPEPEDLGHAGSQWERIPVTDDDQVIFLPGEEEDLEDDAFVVLDEGDLCDLLSRR